LLDCGYLLHSKHAVLEECLCQQDSIDLLYDPRTAPVEPGLAKAYFKPELARIVAQQAHIHDRLIENFIAASIKHRYTVLSQ